MYANTGHIPHFGGDYNAVVRTNMEGNTQFWNTLLLKFYCPKMTINIYQGLQHPGTSVICCFFFLFKHVL